MNESEWLAATDPTPMVDFLKDKATDRKLRLLGVACCRRIEQPFLRHEPLPQWQNGGRLAVDTAERHADGQASDEELYNAGEEAEFCGGSEYNPFRYLTMTDRADLLQVAYVARNGLAGWELLRLRDPDDPAHLTEESSVEFDSINSQERIAQANLLRDIFGNPFRKVKFNKKWRSSTVVALAKEIYEAKAFDQLPILADALQDAGCENEDILTHCRGPGPHVRGCFVVDLLLGKS